MITPGELRHVLRGPRPDEQAAGVGLVSVTFRAEAPDTVLGRSREVLATVLRAPAQSWPTTADWAGLLPAWFVTACADEPTDQEQHEWLQRWRSLDGAGRSRAEAEKRWTLSSWLSWLEPVERDWFWWDATTDGNKGRVLLELPGWPAPVGALLWLLRAAGADSIESPDL